MVRRFVVFLIAGLAVAPALPAPASPEGRVAAGLVSEENYRHILDDMLYTHAGDDRDVFGADHDPARANIYNLFQTYGLNVVLEPFDFLGEYTLYNVVATKVGVTDPTIEYVIGAHHDSVGNPGADDNASGVALVLEAARVLSAYPSDYTIRFVAFDAEEWGLWGAEAYVNTHITDDIRGMISADMVAWNRDGDSYVKIFGFEESNPLKFGVADAVDTYGKAVSPCIRGLSLGDHIPFEVAGFQACLLIENGGNPYYHTQQDNVDMPNYIDYEFAANNTRSVVGFLVDHAGVHVTIPDADYDDDGDVDQDDFDAFSTCYSGSGNPPDTGCEFFDFDGDNDVDCNDWYMLQFLWTEPGDPPTFSLCLPCFMSSPAQPETLALASDPVNQKIRYMSFSAGNPGQSQAVRITFETLPAPYNAWNGVQMWVQQPTEFCENAGKVLPPNCPPAEPRTDWTGATLGCRPWFGDFYSLGVVHVFHEGIIPGGSYWVEVTEETCHAIGLPVGSFSPPLVMEQSRWGDLVRNCQTYPCGPPDGTVGIPTDVTAVLDKFKNLGPAGNPPVTKVRADLDWETPNQRVDISDVTFCLDAFRGFQYPPESFLPPSSPPCGG